MNNEPKPKTLGVVGLGLVGSALVHLFTEQGWTVFGFDIDPDSGRETDSVSFTRVESLRAVSERCSERVLLSLPTSDEVEAVVEGPGGLARQQLPPKTIIDTTTTHPDRTKSLADRCERCGIEFLDSTLVGSSVQILKRESQVLVGGNRETFESCSDVWEALSDRVYYMGRSGSGSTAKLVVNLVLGLNRLVLAEGLALAEAAGVPPGGMLEILSEGPASSEVMRTKGPKMVNRDYSAQARLRQHLKDVGLILEMGRRSGCRLRLSELHRDLLEKAVADGWGEADNSSIIEVFRDPDSRDGG